MSDCEGRQGDGRSLNFVFQVWNKEKGVHGYSRLTVNSLRASTKSLWFLWLLIECLIHRESSVRGMFDMGDRGNGFFIGSAGMPICLSCPFSTC